jgi:hypothetical protein
MRRQSSSVTVPGDPVGGSVTGDESVGESDDESSSSVGESVVAQYGDGAPVAPVAPLNEMQPPCVSSGAAAAQ